MQPAEENEELRDKRKNPNQPIRVHRCRSETDLLTVFAIQKTFKQRSKLTAGPPVEAAGEDVLGFATCDTR